MTFHAVASPSSSAGLLLRLFAIALLPCGIEADPHTTGIYRASIREQLLFDTLVGEVNVFVTDEAEDSGILGFNGLLRGFPLLDDGLSDEVHVVVHAGKSCDDPLGPIEHMRGQQFNFTFGIDTIGQVYPVGSEVYNFPETFDFRAVIVYLTNGTVVGCGQLNHIEDYEAVEVFANALQGQAGYQAEITGVVSPELNNFCYFGTMVGLPSNLVSANCSSASVLNQCSLHIRSQSSCDEDLNEALVPNSDAWTWSRYYWTNADGFSVVSNCVDATVNIDTILDSNSLLIYSPEGTAVACGVVQAYEAPPPPRESLKRSQVYCAYFKNLDNYQQKFWGAMFIFQDTATIQHGVIGLAGHIYNDTVCATETCDLLLSTAKTCDEYHTGTVHRLGVLSTNSDGSMFGTWDVTMMDLEDTLAILRLANGTVVSCDYIKEVPDSTVYQIDTSPYVGRSIVSEVTSSNAFAEDLCSFGFAYGLEADLSDCGDACSYQVHTGTNCDNPGDALFNSDALNENPWQNSRYSTPDSNGVSVFGGCVNTKYSSFEYKDRAMVMRGPDNLPASCGVMKQFEPLEFNGSCDLCPFDAFEISAPNAMVNLGGPVNVTCKAMQDSAASAAFSFDDCMRAKQQASTSCGCVPPGWTNLSVETKSSRTIGLSVAAAVVIAILAALTWLVRFRKGATTPKKNGPVETPAEEVAERGTERRSPSLSADSVSALPSAIAVAVGQQEPTLTTAIEQHDVLSTKNQLRGGSFWKAEPASIAPYADAYEIREESEQSNRGNENDESMISV